MMARYRARAAAASPFPSTGGLSESQFQQNSTHAEQSPGQRQRLPPHLHNLDIPADYGGLVFATGHQKLAYNAHKIATTATLAILNEALVA